MSDKFTFCLKYVVLLIIYSVLYWFCTFYFCIDAIGLALQVLPIDNWMEASGSANADMFILMIIYFFIMLLLYLLLLVLPSLIFLIIKLLTKNKTRTL